MRPRVGQSGGLIVVTKSPNFRDGISSALVYDNATYIKSIHVANDSSLNAHKRTLEVFMFRSVSCMATYYAPEALGDIIY